MGYLISIEGGEFVGKTSVVTPSLKEILSQLGKKVVISREPGGTKEAERIRQEIFAKLKQGISPEEQLILFNQARSIHINQLIKPVLGENKKAEVIVILDRYLDSTRVYQGLEGNIPLSKILSIEKKYVGSMLPDVTVVLYFPETIFTETFIQRKQSSQWHHGTRDSNPFDEVSILQHRLRQQYFLHLAELAKNNSESRIFLTINTAQKPAMIMKQLIRQLLPAIQLKDKIKRAYKIINNLESSGYWKKISQANI